MTGRTIATATPRATDKDKRAYLILEGPVGRGVFLIAMPSVAMMMVNTLNGFLDRFFVGKLGPEAMAAVTVCTSWMWLLLAAAMAVSVGTSALVGRFVGANSHAEANQAARQSILVGLLLSLVVSGGLALARDPILRAQGLDAATLPLASRYLLILALGQPIQFLAMICGGIFRGLGDTVRPFYVTLGSVFVHAIFNYLLIFGNFGFPQMGIAGGALAMVLSQVMNTGLSVWFLRRSSVGGGLVGPWKVEWDWAWRILRIGLLAAVQQVVRMSSMLLLQGLLARSGAGSAAVAALGVGLISESIAFMPGFGYSIAASAFVGQNLGAGKPQRANAGAWAATWQAVAVMSAMGVLFYFCAGPFAHLFLQHTDDPLRNAKVDETMALAISYLRIAAISEPFLALSMGLVGALQGAGETASPTWLTTFSMVVFRLPLAWILLKTIGVEGGWWAMSLSTIVQGIMVVWVFRQGNWTRVRV